MAKCIQNIDTKEIFRVSDQEAQFLVQKKKHIFVSKSRYRWYKEHKEDSSE